MTKTYTPVTPDQIGKTVEVSDCGKNWYTRELAAILPRPSTDGDHYICYHHNGLISSWRKARVETRPGYSEGQQASGLKVGDWVRVTRSARTLEDGWQGMWNEGMDQYLGSILQIKEDYSSAGFLLAGANFVFPYYVLEKVTHRDATASDVGKQVSWKKETRDRRNGDLVLMAVFHSPDGMERAVVNQAGVFLICFLCDVTISLEDQA